jgi:hypothetical protein
VQFGFRESEKKLLEIFVRLTEVLSSCGQALPPPT